MFINKRHKYNIPPLNTSSLPDLIFTVLFFFMMVTHMRSVPAKVEYTVPQGSELTRLTKKSAVVYIYIGVRQDDGRGETRDGKTYIQLGDRLATIDDIADFISAERSSMAPEDRERLTVSVKADRDTPMAVISEVRQALRIAGVRRVAFSASGENDKLKQK